MPVPVYAESSDTFILNHASIGHEVISERVLIGTYYHVQLTYAHLRDDIGKIIAYYDEDFDGWVIARGSKTWRGYLCSDIIFASE